MFDPSRLGETLGSVQSVVVDAANWLWISTPRHRAFRLLWRAARSWLRRTCDQQGGQDHRACLHRRSCRQPISTMCALTCDGARPALLSSPTVDQRTGRHHCCRSRQRRMLEEAYGTQIDLADPGLFLSKASGWRLVAKESLPRPTSPPTASPFCHGRCYCSTTALYRAGICIRFHVLLLDRSASEAAVAAAVVDLGEKELRMVSRPMTSRIYAEYSRAQQRFVSVRWPSVNGNHRARSKDTVARHFVDCVGRLPVLHRQSSRTFNSMKGRISVRSPIRSFASRSTRPVLLK